MEQEQQEVVNHIYNQLVPSQKNDVSSELSSIERKNVMLIQRYE